MLDDEEGAGESPEAVAMRTFRSRFLYSNVVTQYPLPQGNALHENYDIGLGSIVVLSKPVDVRKL